MTVSSTSGSTAVSTLNNSWSNIYSLGFLNGDSNGGSGSRHYWNMGCELSHCKQDKRKVNTRRGYTKSREKGEANFLVEVVT
jgi:hypothetical protein